MDTRCRSMAADYRQRRVGRCPPTIGRCCLPDETRRGAGSRAARRSWSARSPRASPSSARPPGGAHGSWTTRFDAGAGRSSCTWKGQVPDRRRGRRRSIVADELPLRAAPPRPRNKDRDAGRARASRRWGFGRGAGNGDRVGCDSRSPPAPQARRDAHRRGERRARPTAARRRRRSGARTLLRHAGAAQVP